MTRAIYRSGIARAERDAVVSRRVKDSKHSDAESFAATGSRVLDQPERPGFEDPSGDQFGPDPSSSRPTARPGLVSVLLPVAVAGAYSYRLPDGLPLFAGDIVTVPLATREAVGVVWDDPPDEEIDHDRLRAVVGKLDAAPLSREIRAFVDWVANYTLTTRGMVLRMVLRAPGALPPERPVPGVRATGAKPERMTDARARVLALSENGLSWPRSG